MVHGIALCGKSGSGKTTVAKMLSEKGYQHVETGALIRRLASELFESDSKTVMNEITDALRGIDPTVIMRVALREASAPRLVVDSMRYVSDYDFLKASGFCSVLVVTSTDIRAERLNERGQAFSPSVDGVHPSEIELEKATFDFTIVNDGSREALRLQVSRLVDPLTPE